MRLNRFIPFSITIALMATLQGCSQRERVDLGAERSSRLVRRQEARRERVNRPARERRETRTVQKEEATQTAHRFTFVPFAYEPAVEGQDAAHFSMYALKWMQEKEMGEFVQTEPAVKEMTAMLDQALNPSQALKDRHQVDAVISGIVHGYRYGLERDQFHQEIDLTLKVVSPDTGKEIYTGREKISRNYRVGRDDRDFRELNSRTLNDLLSRIRREAGPKIQMALNTVSQKPQVVVAQEEAKPQEEENITLWSAWDMADKLSSSFKTSPTPKAPDEATPKKEDRLDNLLNRFQTAVAKQSTEIEAVQPVVEPAPRPVKKAQAAPIQNNPIAAPQSIPYDDLNLAIAGFSHVWPEELSTVRRYEKLFYVPRGQEQSVPVGASPEASRSLALEIFQTTSEYAVSKFLKDYFEGLEPVPMGKIPQAWERYEMGRWQLGFRLGLRAFIATAPRGFRDAGLNGLSELYTQNGGLPLSKVLAQARPANLAMQTAEAAPEPPVKTTPKAVEAPKPAPRTQAKTAKPVTQAPKEPAQQVAEVKAPTPMSPKEIQAERNAFLLDMAQKEMDARDFEQAERYLLMAREQGASQIQIDTMLASLTQMQLADTLPTKAPVMPEIETNPEAERLAGILEEIRLETVPIPSETRIADQTPAQVSTPRPAAIQEAVEELPKEVVAAPKPDPSDRKPEPRRLPSEDPEVDAFYAEMEKIEAELEKIRNANGLMTVGKENHKTGVGDLLMQAAILLGFAAAGVGFLVQKR